MPYATEQHIAESYGAARLDMLADPDASGTRDLGRIARALDSASAVIDGYIANRYTLPLPSTPAVLTEICVSIAVYKMATEATMLSDDIRQRYEDAIAFLKDLAKGLAALSLPTTAAGVSAAPAQTQSPQAVLVDSSPRTFSRASLRNM